MNLEKRVREVLNWVTSYVTFFSLVAFVTTCCMILFVTTMVDTLPITLTSENINTAAKLTFLNVVILSLLFTVIDVIRRKLTVERPAKRITDAAEKIMPL